MFRQHRDLHIPRERGLSHAVVLSKINLDDREIASGCAQMRTTKGKIYKNNYKSALSVVMYRRAFEMNFLAPPLIYGQCGVLAAPVIVSLRRSYAQPAASCRKLEFTMQTPFSSRSCPGPLFTCPLRVLHLGGIVLAFRHCTRGDFQLLSRPGVRLNTARLCNITPSSTAPRWPSLFIRNLNGPRKYAERPRPEVSRGRRRKTP